MLALKESVFQELNTLDDEQIKLVSDFIAFIKFRSSYANLPELKLPDLKPKRLSEFYGSLPATVPYPGKEEIRQSVAENIAQETLVGNS